MFYGANLKALREEDESLSSTDAMFDGKETEEVAEELSDMMESIPEDGVEETTNGGVPFTAEMCSLVKTESANIYGRRKPRYLLELSVLNLYRESEEVDDVEDAVEDVAAAHSGQEDDEGNTVEIDKADIVVVAPSDEEVKEIVDDAVQEAKLLKGVKGAAQKKLNKLTKDIKDLKNKGIKVAKKGCKSKKKC